MAKFTALLDANVLYPAGVRDIFMELAVSDLFEARWTDDIHNEWIESLLKNRSDLRREQLERTRNLMDQHVRDALITGYESLIPSLHLPDPDDRHVLAAAIVGRCDVVVTFNLSDFPEDVLLPFGIEVQHPDKFLHSQFDLSPSLFQNAIATILHRINKTKRASGEPPRLITDHLEKMSSWGLKQTATELAKSKKEIITMENLLSLDESTSPQDD